MSDNSTSPETQVATDHVPVQTQDSSKEKPIEHNNTVTEQTSNDQLAPPSTGTKDPSAASSVTSLSLEKEKAFNDAETESQRGNALNLTKTKTATSHKSHGLELKKTKTIAETLHSISEQFPSSVKLIGIVVALALSIFLVALDMTIVATAIPEITSEFSSLPDVGWYGSAFFLTVASFQSTWGKIYRYFPLKSSFLASIFLFEVGSLICAVAQNSVTLIVGRAIAGVGGAGVASGAYTIMAFSAPPERRAAFTGIMGAAGFSTAIIFIFFQAPPAAKPQQASWKEKLLQMDFPGTFVFMAAVICYLLAVQWGGTTKAWSDSQVIGLLVGFGTILILFIVIEYYSGERALLQGRLLKQRNLLMAMLFIFFFAGSFFVLLYYLPIYFQSVDGVSPSDSGVRNIPLLVATSIFSILSGGLIGATGWFQPFLISGAAITAVGSGLIYTLDIGTEMGKWIGYQVVAGVGIGLAIQTAIIVGQSSVDPSDLSTVTAMILFFQTIGGAFFVQAGQAAFSNQLLKNLPTYAPGISPELVIGTGASDLRNVFTPEQLPGILQAYMSGLRVSYGIGIGLSGVAFFVAFFSEWKSIKGRTPSGGAA